jgi:hypothetical protein
MTDTYVPKVGTMFDARDRRHRKHKLRGAPFLCTGLIPPKTGLQMILAKDADGRVRQFPHASFVFFPG